MTGNDEKAVRARQVVGCVAGMATTRALHELGQRATEIATTQAVRDADGEAVAWQERHLDIDTGEWSQWRYCAKHIHEASLSFSVPEHEVRELYLAPPAAVPVGKLRELVEVAVAQGKRLQWPAVMDTLERIEQLAREHEDGQG